MRLQRDGSLRAYWMEPPLLQPQAFGAESDVQRSTLMLAEGLALGLGKPAASAAAAAANATAIAANGTGGAAQRPRVIRHRRFSAERRGEQGPVRLIPAFASQHARRQRPQNAPGARGARAHEAALAAAMAAMRGEPAANVLAEELAANVLAPET